MKRRAFLWRTQTLAAGSLVGAPLSRARAASPPLAIGAAPQLFLDDFLIERLTGLQREVQAPQRHGPPVLDSRTFGVTQPYLTVLRDEVGGKWRMFYNHDAAIWHAESEDGLAWKNPRVVYDCLRGFGCSVVDDGSRAHDPARRFKMAHWRATPAKDGHPGDDSGMWIYFSPDGFQWIPHARNPVLPTWPEGFDRRVRHGIGDTVDVAYDSLAQCYRAAVKVQALPEDGYLPGPKSGHGIRRLVGMSTSDDFIEWKKPWRILVPDAQDDGLLEFYGMGALHQRGGLQIGLARVLRDDLPCDPGGPANGLGYTVLATSRDGVTWRRDRVPFLDRNPEPGSWDHAMTWASMVVPVGDEVFFYYGGYARGHKIAVKTERQIGLARMKKDRYVALKPAGAEGTLLTKTFTLPGDRLTLNAAAVGGEVRVRLLDETGKSLSAGTQPITGDVLAAEVAWAKPVSALRGRAVRLEFSVRDAALFAFEFPSSRPA